MNHDDIIRMARECPLVTTTNRDGIYIEALERFAELVAAADRKSRKPKDCLAPFVSGSSDN